MRRSLIYRLDAFGELTSLGTALLLVVAAALTLAYFVCNMLGLPDGILEAGASVTCTLGLLALVLMVLCSLLARLLCFGQPTPTSPH